MKPVIVIYVLKLFPYVGDVYLFISVYDQLGNWLLKVMTTTTA